MTSSAGPRDGAPPSFLELCHQIASRHRSPGESAKTWVSMRPMLESAHVSVEVDVARLADFLNEVGEILVAHRYADVQMSLQRRSEQATAGVDTEFWGAVIDVDQVANDTVALWLEAGVVAPNLVWDTESGHKAAICFANPARRDDFQAFCKFMTLAVPGGDPASWEPSQMQRLPTCFKSTPDGLVEIEYRATQISSAPFSLSDWEPRLPPRVLRAIGGGGEISAIERGVVERFLADLGISVPDSPGKRLNERCPDKHHSGRKCYANRGADGSLSLYCLGGHGGLGPRGWSEGELLAVANGVARSGSRIDPVRDVPATWAGEAFLRDRFSTLENAPVDPRWEKAAIELWRFMKARDDQRRFSDEAHALLPGARTPPTVDQFLHLHGHRLSGGDDAGAFPIAYDETSSELVILNGSEPAISLNVSGSAFSEKSHRHEWESSLAHRYSPVLDKIDHVEVVVAERCLDRRFLSHWNKALVGHPGCLAALGIPRRRAFDFPVAHVTDGWSIAETTKTLRWVNLPGLPDSGKFDPLKYLFDLFDEGRLPLASRDQVPRLAMLIASPLLRDLLPGQLGLYWLIGPSGAGKEFLVRLCSLILQESVNARVTPEFELNCTNDLELKRSFFSAGRAVYARAKEAGKRPRLHDELVRLAGTSSVAARGMRRDEILVPNSWTFVADSAESVPPGRELARRTVQIFVAPMAEDVSKGEVLAEVRQNAPLLVAGFKALIETRSPDWFLQRTDTRSRPLGPSALAQLFGAELDTVESRNLDGLFEAMLAYVDTASGRQEGRQQLEKAKARNGKDGASAELFQSYRLSHFIDVMKREPGHEELFRELATGGKIIDVLSRETDFARTRQGAIPYLQVACGGTRYAFEVVKANRCFVLEPELTYCDKREVRPTSGASDRTTEPIRFSDTDFECAARGR